MNSRLKVILLITLGLVSLYLLLLAFFGIFERPTSEEKQTLRTLIKKYGKEYNFNYTFGDSQYLDISKISGSSIDKDEGCKIFKDYIAASKARQRIVNFYEKGEFSYQIIVLKKNSEDCEILISGKGVAERY